MKPSLGMTGHDHHKMMIAEIKRRFFVVPGLTVSIILISPMFQNLVKVHWQFTGSNYILLVLSTIVFIYGGYPFLKGFISEIKSKSPAIFSPDFMSTKSHGLSESVLYPLFHQLSGELPKALTESAVPISARHRLWISFLSIDPAT
jgi:Cu2+-exporting ATPase